MENLGSINNNPLNDIKGLIFGDYNTLAKSVFNDPNIEKYADENGTTEQQIFAIIVEMKKNGATELTEENFEEYYIKNIEIDNLNGELSGNLYIVSSMELDKGLTKIEESIDNLYKLILMAKVDNDELKIAKNISRRIKNSPIDFINGNIKVTEEEKEIAKKFQEVSKEIEEKFLSNFSKIDLDNPYPISFNDHDDTVQLIAKSLEVGKTIEDIIKVIDLSVASMLKNDPETGKVGSIGSQLEKVMNKLIERNKTTEEKVKSKVSEIID